MPVGFGTDPFAGVSALGPFDRTQLERAQLELVPPPAAAPPPARPQSPGVPTLPLVMAEATGDATELSDDDMLSLAASPQADVLEAELSKDMLDHVINVRAREATRAGIDLLAFSKARDEAALAQTGQIGGFEQRALAFIKATLPDFTKDLDVPRGGALPDPTAPLRPGVPVPEGVGRQTLGTPLGPLGGTALPGGTEGERRPIATRFGTSQERVGGQREFTNADLGPPISEALPKPAVSGLAQRVADAARLAGPARQAPLTPEQETAFLTRMTAVENSIEKATDNFETLRQELTTDLRAGSALDANKPLVRNLQREAERILALNAQANQIAGRVGVGVGLPEQATLVLGGTAAGAVIGGASAKFELLDDELGQDLARKFGKRLLVAPNGRLPEPLIVDLPDGGELRLRTVAEVVEAARTLQEQPPPPAAAPRFAPAPRTRVPGVPPPPPLPTFLDVLSPSRFGR